jgi:flagella basal body P-ring formation protein FlgA
MKRTSNNLQLPHTKYPVFLAVVILLFAAFAGNAQDKITIRVAAEATIESDRVTLGDISRISGGVESAGRLGSISLGYAPNIGMSREINRAQIVLAISAAGFSEGDFVLDSSLNIVIHRTGQQVSEVQIRETVEKSVLALLPADRIEARVLRLEVPPRILVPAGKLEIRTNIAGIRNLFARFSLPVEIRVNNKIVRTFAANIEIEAFANVAVAVKELAGQAKIIETDVRFERKRLVRPLASYVLDAARLRGAMLIKDITAGSELTSDLFVAGIVIKYGDAVRLEAVSGTLKVTINGEARSAGKIGDRIAVKNMQSGAILQAFVVDEGIARVAF